MSCNAPGGGRLAGIKVAGCETRWIKARVQRAVVIESSNSGPGYAIDCDEIAGNYDFSASIDYWCSPQPKQAKARLRIGWSAHCYGQKSRIDDSIRLEPRNSLSCFSIN